jgi:hypothetical protein
MGVSKGVETAIGAATGAPGETTVIETVAVFEVPPGTDGAVREAVGADVSGGRAYR